MLEALGQLGFVLEHGPLLGLGQRLGQHDLHRVAPIPSTFVAGLPDLRRAARRDVVQQQVIVDNDFVGQSTAPHTSG